MESATEKARAAAEGKEVSRMGSTVVQQCLQTGFPDEITFRLVPVLLVRGVSLFGGLKSETAPDLDLVRAVDAPGVTHLTYRVVK